MPFATVQIASTSINSRFVSICDLKSAGTDKLTVTGFFGSALYSFRTLRMAMITSCNLPKVSSAAESIFPAIGHVALIKRFCGFDPCNCHQIAFR